LVQVETQVEHSYESECTIFPSRANEQLRSSKLTARVGIDSGAVVVGAGIGSKADVFGDTPNIAARVKASALPDTVLITADTHRLISGLIVVEDRGKHILKGIEQPLQLYRVIRASVEQGRLQASASARGLTPFVGRDDELRLFGHPQGCMFAPKANVAACQAKTGPLRASALCARGVR